LDAHREPLVARVEARAFGDGPREERAVVLQAEVVVQVRGEMFLDDEDALLLARRLASAAGFGGGFEISLGVVFGERAGFGLGFSGGHGDRYFRRRLNYAGGAKSHEYGT